MILVDSFHAIQVSETVFNSDKLILHVWNVKSLFEGIDYERKYFLMCSSYYLLLWKVNVHEM